jgi:hypothetical protein
MSLFSQKEFTFGEISDKDLAITSFPGDENAHAVVLKEEGNYYFDIIQRQILLVKEYHAIIKILDKEGFKEGTVSIPYYRGTGSSEKVENIRAITHNGSRKTNVMPNAIFDKNLNGKWSEKTFTFSDIREGSILEYTYKIHSPFIDGFNGWVFQSQLPKLYSEFNARVPGNYRYNRALIGSHPLDVNDARLLRECFRIPGAIKAADCEVLRYVMTNIPAFKEEDYMLAPTNYRSQIEFELSEYYRLDGVTERYTKSWDDVDKQFKNDRDLGRQLTKKGFFEKNVPDELFREKDHLKLAKNIYGFVRDYYTWNGNYGIYTDVRVKEAFDNRKGNVGEINIALINLLNIAGIKTELMLISTREHGLPKKSHPVMSDFNYVIARAVINDTTYLLDASDKFIPFGMLPFRCLNYYGRVMDFKEKSSWLPIMVDEDSKYSVRAQITIDPERQIASGIWDELTTGYEAIDRRRSLQKTNEEAYLNEIEGSLSGALQIVNYERSEEHSSEKVVSERFHFEMDQVFQGDAVYINPFLPRFFDRNPFLAENRQYPVDFGYTRKYTYTVSIPLPDGYSAESLPAATAYNLPNNKGVLKFEAARSGNNISIYYNLSLNSPIYSAGEYQKLQTMFYKAMEIQNNSLIIIKKQT